MIQILFIFTPIMAQSLDSNLGTQLQGIVQNTDETAQNTQQTNLQKTDTDDYIVISLSLFAALGTILTWLTLRNESKQQLINRKFQKKILDDLLRHFFRNKIIIQAMAIKLNEKENTSEIEKNTFYPSEEHLLKLKVMPGDMKFDKFNNTPDFYDYLHQIEIKFRNFNTEVDVALSHIKDCNIEKSIKLRDLDTLDFKMQYLSVQVIFLILILRLINIDTINRKEKRKNNYLIKSFENDPFNEDLYIKKSIADILKQAKSEKKSSKDESYNSKLVEVEKSIVDSLNKESINKINDLEFYKMNLIELKKLGLSDNIINRIDELLIKNPCLSKHTRGLDGLYNGLDYVKEDVVKYIYSYLKEIYKNTLKAYSIDKSYNDMSRSLILGFTKDEDPKDNNLSKRHNFFDKILLDGKQNEFSKNLSNEINKELNKIKILKFKS